MISRLWLFQKYTFIPEVSGSRIFKVIQLFHNLEIQALTDLGNT